MQRKCGDRKRESAGMMESAFCERTWKGKLKWWDRFRGNMGIAKWRKDAENR